MWVGTDAGLSRYDRRRDRFLNVPLGDEVPVDQVSGMHQDRAGELWLAHWGGGLSRLSGGLDRPRVEHYRHDDRDPFSLSSDQLFDFHEDRSGILWIATFNGLNAFDRRRERFEVFRRGSGGLSGDEVWGVTQDREGVLWVATADGGLTGLDRTGGKVVDPLWRAGGAPVLTGGPALAVLEDRLGELWIGTGSSGLVRLGRDRRLRAVYRPDPQDPASVATPFVRQLLEDRLGRLWVGGQLPLQRFVRAPGRGHFIAPGSAGDDPGATVSAYVYDLYEDRSGGLWVATTAGLERFDEETERFVRYRHDPSDRNSLSSNVIHAVFEDAAGIFWIGTDAGLNRWHRERGELRHYRERDGLPSDKVVAVQADEAGRLWLATAAGLSRFDPRSDTFRNYDIDDGLHGNVLYIGADFKSEQGELFFGGPSGLTSFFPDRVEDDPTPPAVVLTQLRLAGEPARQRRLDPESPLREAISEAREIVLDYRQRVFSLEFAALHFANPSKNRYAYRLEGFEEDWSSADASRPVARYTNLDAGRYVFRVKASNPDGAWNEDGASLEIVVRPPPWRTWWAYSLYGLGLGAAIALYVRSHRQELRRERRAAAHQRALNARLREVDRVKDEFLANTSHELRTPLYGITGLAESLIDGAAGELPAAAKDNLSLLVHSGRRLTSLVNDILDFSKLRHRSLELDLKPVDLYAMVDVVLVLSRPLLGSKDVELRNRVASDLPAAEADENRLQQILHNLIGNAVKFTESGEIVVDAVVEDVSRPPEDASEARSTSARQPRIVISVRDTGIGISEDQQARVFEAFAQADASIEREFGGTGLGLAVTRRLIDLHGGTLRLKSAPGEGSTFFFDLPISEKPARGPADARQARSPSTGADASAAEVSEESRAPAASAEPSVLLDDGGAPADPDGDAAATRIRGDGASVLVVDDEPVIRRVVTNQLASHGFRVTSAGGGPEALRRIGEGAVDLVILDLMMPRMSGFEVCRRLRERFSLEELPIIFLTATDRTEDLVVGLAAGANDYLAKPVSKSELLARVQTHVALLSVHRQLAGMVSERTSQLAERGRLLTERERLISELEARNAELARFNQTVAHDLKNPLTTIRNFIGLLGQDDTVRGHERLSADVHRIAGAASNLHRLLDELHEFSRVERAATPHRTVAFGALVRQAVEELAPKLAERGVEVEVAEDLPAVRGDRARLLEAMSHLLSNALQYLGDQAAPRIEIGVRGSETREVTFYVRDNGIGIDPRYHDTVFGLFDRLDPQGSEGTGIGLALVKRIVEVHGGRTWVESEGIGARVHVLPDTSDSVDHQGKEEGTTLKVKTCLKAGPTIINEPHPSGPGQWPKRDTIDQGLRRGRRRADKYRASTGRPLPGRSGGGLRRRRGRSSPPYPPEPRGRAATRRGRERRATGPREIAPRLRRPTATASGGRRARSSPGWCCRPPRRSRL